MICGKSKKINIHHLNYACKFKEDILKDLVPLCSSCHKKVHEKMKLDNIKNISKEEFNRTCVNYNPNNQRARWIPKKK
jgi:predicted HNH restriction endonuclease